MPLFVNTSNIDTVTNKVLFCLFVKNVGYQPKYKITSDIRKNMVHLKIDFSAINLPHIAILFIDFEK